MSQNMQAVLNEPSTTLSKSQLGQTASHPNQPVRSTITLPSVESLQKTLRPPPPTPSVYIQAPELNDGDTMDLDQSLQEFVVENSTYRDESNSCYSPSGQLDPACHVGQNCHTPNESLYSTYKSERNLENRLQLGASGLITAKAVTREDSTDLKKDGLYDYLPVSGTLPAFSQLASYGAPDSLPRAPHFIPVITTSSWSSDSFLVSSLVQPQASYQPEPAVRDHLLCNFPPSYRECYPSSYPCTPINAAFSGRCPELQQQRLLQQDQRYTVLATQADQTPAVPRRCLFPRVTAIEGDSSLYLHNEQSKLPFAPVPQFRGLGTKPPISATFPSPGQPKRDGRVCTVCGDKASGTHYGAWTCEGCFRWNPSSPSDTTSDLGKIPNSKSTYVCDASSDQIATCPSPFQLKKSASTSVAEKLAASLTKLLGTCYQNALQHLIREVPDHDSELSNLKFSGDHLVEVVHKVSRTFLCTAELHFIYNFTMQLSDFTELETQDQATLLPSALLEIAMFRLFSEYREPLNDAAITTSKLTDRYFVTKWSGILTGSDLESFGFAASRSLVDKMFDFGARISQLHLSEGEVGLLMGIIIFTPERPGLCDPERIHKLQDTWANFLCEFCEYEGSRTRCAHLLLLLPQLREFCEKSLLSINSQWRDSDLQLPNCTRQFISPSL
ncbi:unnamed protein product [Schistocephalus solidus]|uniref:NR LBD domain-containing protein n=1 Tax=Schistocephalus solidus TaxID=70667 RepID=A0A183TD24_SCHSO|nr:unnamed protein product [Schistocephalus solidus]